MGLVIVCTCGSSGIRRFVSSAYIIFVLNFCLGFALSFLPCVGVYCDFYFVLFVFVWFPLCVAFQ